MRGMQFASQLMGGDTLGSDFKKSTLLHALLFIFITVKTVFFPGRFLPVTPTLRVDLVALPDNLKKKVQIEIQRNRANSQVSTPRPAPAFQMGPASAKRNPIDSLTQKNSRALSRIKALDSVDQTSTPKKANSDPSTEKETEKFQGNKLSPGQSTSDEAKEGAKASYFDALRDKIKENWELPPWLTREELAAQVQIRIDRDGMVQELYFVKPSGNPRFDDAVNRAIEESSPFPPPPEDLSDSLLSHGILIGFPL